MSNYISDELLKQIDESQWEAEYGDDRNRLVEEEADNASIGEQGHDACFPKADTWTVWINLVDNGISVNFYDMEEAYDFALAFLYDRSNDPVILGSFRSLEFHNLINNHNVFYVGRGANLQAAIFRGSNPSTRIKRLSNNKLIKLDAASAIHYTENSYLCVKPLNDWRSYIGSETLDKISSRKKSTEV